MSKAVLVIGAGLARLRDLTGWQRWLAALLAGGLSALGFAPFGLFPLMLLGFAALVLLLDGVVNARRPLWAALGAGWWFGFGQFLIGLHWIGYAFMVDAADHAWQLPFVAVLFPGGLALFPAAACAVAAKWWRPGPARILAFSLCYAVSEWLRGHILTGFPWNIAGYGWWGNLAVTQSAAMFGVYTLSLLTVLLGASLAELIGGGKDGGGLRWKFPTAMIGLFVLFWVGGMIRLADQPTVFVPKTTVRIVQPNIPQMEKYRLPYVARNWQRLTALSTKPGAPPPTVVVWPEAAPPFLITYSAEAMEWVADLNARGSVLMTGAIRAEPDADGEATYFNSFYIFRHGRAVASYDKFHLVPFGEYLPFERVLDDWGIKKLTGISGSFGRGDGPHAFAVVGLPDVGPLICYEILFPGAVVGTHRPGWFANVTDDSWFGSWAGPEQHLWVAQVRAIEEGVPVVRAANSGISAIIDPMGRITVRSPMNVVTAIDGALPARIEAWSLSGMQFLWFWAVVGLILVGMRFLTGRK